MKKILLGIAVFFMVALMCIISAGAASYKTIIVSGDFKYDVRDDCTASIKGYIGTDTAIFSNYTYVDGTTL